MIEDNIHHNYSFVTLQIGLQKLVLNENQYNIINTHIKQLEPIGLDNIIDMNLLPNEDSLSAVDFVINIIKVRAFIVIVFIA